MKVGIAGFKGAGKTTVFNALTGLDQDVGYGGQKKLNFGTIKVPDDRLDRLAGIEKPKKVTYAEMIFADPPASEADRRIDPKALVEIRETDALALVLRGFDPGGTPPDPLKELRELETDLILSDLAAVDKRLDRLRKDFSNPKERDLIIRLHEGLSAETPVSRIGLSPEEIKAVKGFAFLSLKPVIVVLNTDEAAAQKPMPEPLVSYAAGQGTGLLSLAGKIEMEIGQLSFEEQTEWLRCMNIDRSCRDRFIQEAFRLLDLIVFFTYGPTECRTWPIKKGTEALEAAAQIHSDIARGFIRAEIMRIDDYLLHQSEAKVKQAGGLRYEGKTYVMQDGDMAHFRFNV